MRLEYITRPLRSTYLHEAVLVRVTVVGDVFAIATGEMSVDQTGVVVDAIVF